MPAIDYARSINLNQRVLGFQLILRVAMAFMGTTMYVYCPLKDCNRTDRVSFKIYLHIRDHQLIVY